VAGEEVWFAGMNILLGGVIILFLILDPRGLYHRWVLLKTSYRIWPFPYV
jgi:branched-chain amino acid transport system permease protein